MRSQRLALFSLACLLAFCQGCSKTTDRNSQNEQTNSNQPSKKTPSEWGHLKGKIIYTGEPVRPIEIKPRRPEEIELIEKNKWKIHDLSFLVDKETQGLQDVFVMMYFGREPEKGKTLKTHPGYAAQSTSPLTIPFEKFQFESKSYLALAGQEIVVENRMNVGMSPRLPMAEKSFSQLIPGGNRFTLEPVNKVFRLPITLECNMHEWVNARILIRHEPYNVTTNANGTFEIRNLPVGKHKFQFWHRKYLKLHDNDDELLTDRRGVIEVEIKPDETLDLGTLILKGKP